MKNLNGTQTLENLAKVFAGESQARNRYTFYGKVADKEGHKQISAVFYETADNERAHAKVFFDLIIEGMGGSGHINVNAQYPVGFGSTKDNLKYAADGEKEEWGTLYPQFADIAKEEGFSEVEIALRKIIEIEKEHEKRYLNLLSSMKNGTLYSRNSPQYWKCRNCGYVYYGNEAPVACPACKHPQGYFEIMYNTQP